MEYPEEIYHVFSDDMSGSGRRHAYEVGHNIGYLKGLAERPDPLTGYSNLTVAIKDNEPIDYEKLDGLKVQLVHPEMGALHGTLNRDKSCSPDDFYGWWDDDKTDLVYTRALCHAWHGRNGWTLWIEGEIPLRRKTADQLEVGTYFRGECVGKKEWFMYVGGEPLGDIRTVYYAPEMFKSDAPTSEWVVLEELGTFQKPEDK